jgi:hypothetical protein
VGRRALSLAVTLVACQIPGNGPNTTRPAPPPPEQYTILDMIGGWRWLLRTDEAGTSRVEDEQWRFRPTPGAPTTLAGRYVRTVEVRSVDRVPFQCNQRPWYRQRAVVDVVAEITPHGFTVRETGYATEPGPCDHGFRHLGDYQVDLDNGRLVLRWDKGSQTLTQLDDHNTELPATPWPASTTLAGPWRWDATSYDDDNNLRDESEWWEITRRSNTRIDATYRRRVTIRSADGKPIPCAGAPSWSFDDAYILEGLREEEHWHLTEVAVEPGDHACLRATPKRSLDEATAEQIGDNVILEWRGKRRQVLYRPEP